MTMDDYKAAENEAQQYVWGGAIPLQIHLHDSEVTTLPLPSPALILASRFGYLPLLVPQIKPFFSSSLPPGVDTVWFDYKGLPLKWYIPTGVLFDLLCAEPERPWNITVHFRGYPENLLIPCEGEESVKWSFINALKEAAYIINGNCKNIMNMSQSDQAELCLSVLNETTKKSSISATGSEILTGICCNLLTTIHEVGANELKENFEENATHYSDVLVRARIELERIQNRLRFKLISVVPKEEAMDGGGAGSDDGDGDSGGDGGFGGRVGGRGGRGGRSGGGRWCGMKFGERMTRLHSLQTCLTTSCKS